MSQSSDGGWEPGGQRMVSAACYHHHHHHRHHPHHHHHHQNQHHHHHYLHHHHHHCLPQEPLSQIFVSSGPTEEGWNINLVPPVLVSVNPGCGGSAERGLSKRGLLCCWNILFPLLSEKHPKAIIPFQRAEFEKGVKYRKRRPGLFGSLAAFSPQSSFLSHAKNKPEETQLCWRLGRDRIKAAPDGYRWGTGLLMVG